jgi:hypothetical protein
MDLLSMLNSDDSSTPRLPVSTPSKPPPPPAPEAVFKKERDVSPPKKRPRVDDETQSAIAPAKPPVPQLAVQTSAVSPTETSPIVPPPRTNSLVSVSCNTIEPTIVNMHLSEELTKFVSDFIYLNLNEDGIENLEVHRSLPGRLMLPD